MDVKKICVTQRPGRLVQFKEHILHLELESLE